MDHFQTAVLYAHIFYLGDDAKDAFVFVASNVVAFQKRLLTSTTESRVAIARISAHETIFGQAVSSSDLIESITSNPLNEFKLGAADFSPTKFGVSSNNTEASHP